MKNLHKILENAFQDAKNLPELSQQILMDVGLFDVPVTAKMYVSMVKDPKDPSYRCVIYSDGFSESRIWEGALTVSF